MNRVASNPGDNHIKFMAALLQAFPPLSSLSVVNSKQWQSQKKEHKTRSEALFE